MSYGVFLWGFGAPHQVDLTPRGNIHRTTTPSFRAKIRFLEMHFLTQPPNPGNLYIFGVSKVMFLDLKIYVFHP